MNCDLCENNQYKVLGNVKNNLLVKCMACGHIYMTNRLETKELLKLYDENYFNDRYISGNENVQTDYLKDKPNILKFAEKRFETIHKYKKPGSILDIGCAAGFYLEHARKLGWEVFGLEISEYAANYARQLLKTENICNMLLENAEFRNEQFDVITLWLVLEHLVNPVESMKKIKKWLKKDGLIGIKVPNADGVTFRSNFPKWLNQHPEDHMCDYTPDTLERIMFKCGFELLELETEGIYLERILTPEQYAGNTKAKELYAYIAKKSMLGDSIVAFFKQKDPSAE